jgi:hypothetical protein
MMGAILTYRRTDEGALTMLELGPEATPDSLLSELHHWIACERDAAWAAKLAILRLERSDDITQFGRYLREHERHADELAQLLGAGSGRPGVPREPCFVTRDPHVIGATDSGDAVLDAMIDLEVTRLARYEAHGQSGDDRARGRLDAILERHAVDARERLAWLRSRRRERSLMHGKAA